MLQQVIALAVILYFIIRLAVQKTKDKVGYAEFIIWLGFWLCAAAAIIFIKRIDAFVAGLGFSGSGIEVLLYAAIAALFYFIFRLRLRLEKMERNITKLVRELALKDGKNRIHKQILNV